MEAVVAVYSDWGIGAKGTQPLVVPADRVRFRELTTGHAVIVGRKTLEDFPGGKPLKNRNNIVITRQNITIDGAEVVHRMEEAMEKAKAYDRCFVIGGASVFKEFYPYLTKVHLTEIDAAPFSDSFFPNLDEAADWQCVQSDDWQEHEGVRYRFSTYERM